MPSTTTCALRPRAAAVIAAVVGVAALAALGGGSAGCAGGGSCEETIRKLCDRAASCSGDGPRLTAQGVGAAHYSPDAACAEILLPKLCAAGETAEQVVDCAEAFNAAPCVDLPSKQRALSLQPACGEVLLGAR